MLNQRHLLVLLALTLVFVAAAVAVLGNRDSDQPQGGLMFPDLLGRLNDVARVRVSAAGKHFDINGSELGWHIPSQDNYRADADKVHKLLVGLSGLKRIEPKTRKPKLYPALGLGDPQQTQAKATGIELLDAADAPLAAVIIGNSRPARADPGAEEYYVRLPADPQSWLVSGALPHTGSGVGDWLDRKIALINGPRLRRTRVTHTDGEVVTAYRESGKDRNFSYREIPAGRELADEWQMNDLGRFAENLDSQGVYAKAKAPPAQALLEAEMQTFDGLRIILRASADEQGEVYAEFAADFDAGESGADGDFKDENLKSADQVRAEVEQLNRRWQGWVYRLPKFKADYLQKRQADFLKKPG